MNVRGNKVYILTSDKEFAVVRMGAKVPVKDSNYTGFEVKEMKPITKLFIAVFLIMIFSSAYYYIRYTKEAGSFSISYTPVAGSSSVSENTNFSFSLNSKGKVMKISSSDYIKNKVLLSLDYKNQDYEGILIAVFDSCSATDLLEGSSKKITIYIDQKSTLELDFTKFKNYIELRKYDLTINNNGILE